MVLSRINKQCVLFKFKLQMEHGHWVIDLLVRGEVFQVGEDCFPLLCLVCFLLNNWLKMRNFMKCCGCSSQRALPVLISAVQMLENDFFYLSKLTWNGKLFPSNEKILSLFAFCNFLLMLTGQTVNICIRNLCQSPPKAIRSSMPFNCIRGGTVLNTSVELQKYLSGMGFAN